MRVKNNYIKKVVYAVDILQNAVAAEVPVEARVYVLFVKCKSFTKSILPIYNNIPCRAIYYVYNNNLIRDRDLQARILNPEL